MQLYDNVPGKVQPVNLGWGAMSHPHIPMDTVLLTGKSFLENLYGNLLKNILIVVQLYGSDICQGQGMKRAQVLMGSCCATA